MARKSTGKRRRFEIFKRDHFTCQYCGAQPPTVVLVCDHITPVSAGGADTEDNLITACEPCNQGKSDKQLSVVGIRPDADLLYLGTQQEIAEMRRYQAVLEQKQAAIDSFVESLQDAWARASGLDWAPGASVLKPLINKYSPEVVGMAVIDVAGKCGTGYIKTYKASRSWVGYLYAVCRSAASQESE